MTHRPEEITVLPTKETPMDESPMDEMPTGATPTDEDQTDAVSPAYAVAVIGEVRVNEELFDYMRWVEATMRDFGGHWISHGRSADVREGTLPGDVVIIGFPDLARARAWYESDEYQAIVPLRTRNSTAAVAIVEGVPPGYSSGETIERMRGAAAA